MYHAQYSVFVCSPICTLKQMYLLIAESIVSVNAVNIASVDSAAAGY